MKIRAWKKKYGLTRHNVLRVKLRISILINVTSGLRIIPEKIGQNSNFTCSNLPVHAIYIYMKYYVIRLVRKRRVCKNIWKRLYTNQTEYLGSFQ